MTDTTQIQERIIAQVIQRPKIGRAEVRPMADGSREVWSYDVQGRPLDVTTVFADGKIAQRSI